MFKIRVLRVLRPNTEEVAGGWRRLHNEELLNLYSSPNVIRVILSKKIRWEEHEACMGRLEMHTNFGQSI
jgi:hypothetical protein